MFDCISRVATIQITIQRILGYKMIKKAYDSSNPPQTNRKLNDNIILEGCSDQHDEEENGKSVYVAWLNKIQKYKKRQDEAFEKVVEFMEPYAISQEHLDSMMAMSKLQGNQNTSRHSKGS